MENYLVLDYDRNLEGYISNLGEIILIKKLDIFVL